MNAIRMMIAIVWLTGLLPGMAQASDADRFVAASRSQQAVLLGEWATTPDPARLPLLQALQQENLYVDAKKHAFTRNNGRYLSYMDADDVWHIFITRSPTLDLEVYRV